MEMSDARGAVTPELLAAVVSYPQTSPAAEERASGGVRAKTATPARNSGELVTLSGKMRDSRGVEAEDLADIEKQLRAAIVAKDRVAQQYGALHSASRQAESETLQWQALLRDRLTVTVDAMQHQLAMDSSTEQGLGIAYAEELKKAKELDSFLVREKALLGRDRTHRESPRGGFRSVDRRGAMGQGGGEGANIGLGAGPGRRGSPRGTALAAAVRLPGDVCGDRYFDRSLVRLWARSVPAVIGAGSGVECLIAAMDGAGIWRCCLPGDVECGQRSARDGCGRVYVLQRVGSTVMSVLPASNAESRLQIRGSLLLLSGKILALFLNLVTQVLTVRYLVKADYGAFAFAVSAVELAACFSMLGLNKACSRFVAIFHERGDLERALGTLVMLVATVLGASVACVIGGDRGERSALRVCRERPAVANPAADPDSARAD